MTMATEHIEQALAMASVGQGWKPLVIAAALALPEGSRVLQVMARSRHAGGHGPTF